jgi:hypothetical protein
MRELARAYVDAWDTVVAQLVGALDELAAAEDLNQSAVLRFSKVASALQVSLSGQIEVTGSRGSYDRQHGSLAA